MTPLRTRFIQDMQLHGFSPKTQSGYVGAVSGLAKHFHKSPDLISEEDLRRYFLFLTLEKKVARTTATFALCGTCLPAGRSSSFSKTRSNEIGSVAAKNSGTAAPTLAGTAIANLAFPGGHSTRIKT